MIPALLDYAANGGTMERKGNRHPSACPHGVYRCRGEDRWCAIAVFDDAEWTSLCRVMGDPEWSASPRFATAAGRKTHEDDLDQLLEQWTVNFLPQELMNMLQQDGVSAGVVETARTFTVIRS
jgi:benzylsuccinate CoA-transferase BbsF subunit